MGGGGGGGGKKYNRSTRGEGPPYTNLTKKLVAGKTVIVVTICIYNMLVFTYNKYSI